MWLKKYWVGPAAFVLSFLVYLQTLCPTVYVEGAGELIGATHFLGTPHPTGYPLFCLVGRLFSALLPFANIAYKVNLAAAFTGALATAALGLFLRCRGCHPWAALGAALGFGFSSTFWSQVVIAEVYGLSMFAVVAVMGVGIRAAERQDERGFLLLAFLMGLGLTTHLTQILVWPGLALLLGWRWPALWRRGRLLGGALLALVGGYSPVLYLLLRNNRGPGFHWGPLNSLSLLWDHLTGAVYRPSFLAMPWEAMGLNARRWGTQIVGEFSPLLIPLIAWGVWVVLRRDRSTLVMVGAAIGVNLLAAWNYHRDPNSLGVFFLLSILGLAIFLGFGLDHVSRRLAALLPGNSGPLIAGGAVALVLLVGNYEKSDRSQNWIAHTYGCDILRSLPERAVLVTDGDDASFLLDYLHRVEGRRPDVTLYNRLGRGTDLLGNDEYHLTSRDRSARRKQREAGLIRAGERPVFYLFPQTMPAKGHIFVPAGLCYQVLPEEEHPDSLTGEIDLANAQRTDLYRDPWVRKIQANYWFMVGEQYQFQGDIEGALPAYKKAAEIAHDSRTTQFNVALILLKNNRVEESLKHAQATCRIDPWQPRCYRLMSQIRWRQGRYQEAKQLLKRAAEMGATP